MKKKILIATIFLTVAVLTGAVLAASQTSCNRYLYGWWGIHIPAHRICATDYYTNENWNNTNGMNCSIPMTYSRYSAWRGFTQANGKVTCSNTDWHFYIPWYETNPVTGADYLYYDKYADDFDCFGKINHYTAYGWTLASGYCVGNYPTYGICITNWNADRDRLLATSCSIPLGSGKRIYSDSARVSW